MPSFDDESYDMGSGEYADYGMESDDRAYESEYDETLDALMEDDSEADDPTERRKRRGGRGRRGPNRQPKPVPTARGGQPYRTPAGQQQYVTQTQLKEFSARIGDDVRRNAMGIKTINARFGQVTGRVDGLVDAGRLQTTRIARLNKQMQLDGALEFAQSISVQTNATTNNLEIVPNFAALLKGAVKTGVLGGSTGALSNPYVVGGIGFLLANTGILQNILAPRPTS